MHGLTRTATHTEVANAPKGRGIRTIEMRLFMRLSEDFVDIDLVNDAYKAVTSATVRVPRSIIFGIGNATLRKDSVHGGACQITVGNRLAGDVTTMRLNTACGRGIVLFFTRDEIVDLMKGLGHLYDHRDEWVDFGEFVCAWPAQRRQANPPSIPLAA